MLITPGLSMTLLFGLQFCCCRSNPLGGWIFFDWTRTVASLTSTFRPLKKYSKSNLQKNLITLDNWTIKFLFRQLCLGFILKRNKTKALWTALIEYNLYIVYSTKLLLNFYKPEIILDLTTYPKHLSQVRIAKSKRYIRNMESLCLFDLVFFIHYFLN